MTDRPRPRAARKELARARRWQPVRTSSNGLLLGAALIGALALVPISPTAAQTENAPGASTIAAWVQAFYDQTRSLTARFRQRYVSRVYQRTDESEGQVRFARPGRMRFDYDAPNGKVIISDGNRLLVYEPPGEGQQRGQYFEQELDDAQLPQALGFLMGTGRLDRDFRFRRLNPEAYHFEDGQILELRARGEPSPHYERILLYVDDREDRRGVVHRVLIVDAQGNRNRFDFTQQRLNRDLGDDVFTWRPPSNAQRIEP